MNLPAGTPIRIAAVLLVVNGLGFGLFTVPVARHLLEHRRLPQMFGSPLFGGGFYKKVGIEWFVVLLGGFLLVSILEVVAGWLLWNGERSGGILALALLPVGAVFWLGFALPFPPLSALVRTALIVLNWSACARSVSLLHESPRRPLRPDNSGKSAGRGGRAVEDGGLKESPARRSGGSRVLGPSRGQPTADSSTRDPSVL